ncbi:DUF2291 domain-containing protein [uncultured Cohaesibacter sp.]|uniref:DUF2291 family protein n=1 Tax=uncultured Cohaesibacter sp. TaxID=1002546 RepID=UPI0029C7BB6F|nr:DUF2291 domain-containing protein [uncultured Cohaesibacter sp.]
MYTQSALRQMVTVVASVGIALTLGACKIIKNEAPKEKAKGEIEFFFADEKFDPDKIVADMWESKLLPFADKNAVELKLVLDALAKDREAAGAQYGHREKPEGSPWNYVVKATAKVIAVNTKSRASTLGLDLEPYDGTVDALLQIGPVVKGTAIRDSLDFLKFDDFTNQLEFARIANAMNDKVKKDVVSAIDREAASDKILTFSGMFTDEGSSKPPSITPVRLTVNGG